MRKDLSLIERVVTFFIDELGWLYVRIGVWLSDRGLEKIIPLLSLPYFFFSGFVASLIGYEKALRTHLKLWYLEASDCWKSLPPRDFGDFVPGWGRGRNV